MLNSFQISFTSIIIFKHTFQIHNRKTSSFTHLHDLRSSQLLNISLLLNLYILFKVIIFEISKKKDVHYKLINSSEHI